MRQCPRPASPDLPGESGKSRSELRGVRSESKTGDAVGVSRSSLLALLTFLDTPQAFLHHNRQVARLPGKRGDKRIGRILIFFTTLMTDLPPKSCYVSQIRARARRALPRT